MEGTSAPAVAEMMAQGLAVVKLENENMNTLAAQRPRDVKALTAAALSELRMFPHFAKKAYYSIPHKDRSEGKEQIVMVEGPSIKAANALTRHWGNNSSGFRIVGADDERIILQGVFVDHETGMRRTAEISVSRKGRNKKEGTYYALPPDRLNMAIQAGGSKAVRNAILNALPIGLVELYFEEAKKLAARGGKVVETSIVEPEMDAALITATIAKSIAQFEAMGVERPEVETYILRHAELDTEEAVSAHLVGLLNAIEEGVTSIEEAFTVPDAEIAEPRRAEPAKQSPGPKDGFTPKAPPAAKKGELPKDRRRTQAKFAAGTCSVCRKGILAGQWLWKPSEGSSWVHEACPS